MTPTALLILLWLILVALIAGLYVRLGLITSPPPVTEPEPEPEPTFVDDFSTLDTTKWTVSTWTAPGGNETHKGTWSADHAFIKDGMLCLKLTQEKVTSGVDRGDFLSIGGEIATKQSFGFGTYEFTARASSTAATPNAVGQPVSGSITGLFNYATRSLTEVDIEVEGGSRNRLIQLTSWKGDTNPNEHNEFTPNEAPHTRFYNYKYVWTPTDITFFVDDEEVAHHTTVVPTTACPAFINHWGTNNTNWGGTATVGTPRYLWVKRFAYTPLP